MIYYIKWKAIIILNILFLSNYFTYFKLLLLPIILNDISIRIENYLKQCSRVESHISFKNKISKNPKISIISPVYNTGKFVLRFLRSIQNQKFKDIEILLIDDNSNDDSVELIKKYQLDDNRIILIENKINKGTFICRNIGIIKSKGDYIFLTDSDDILLENTLNYFYNYAKMYNYDFIRFNVYLSYGKSFFSQIIKKLESKPIYQPELSSYIFYGLGFLFQIDYNVSNKIIKREALIRALNILNNIYLNLYMTCHEDGLLNYILYRTSKSAYFIKKFGYYYIKNNYKHRSGYYNFKNIKFSFIHLAYYFYQ